jgi:hypothetical protein
MQRWPTAATNVSVVDLDRRRVKAELPKAGRLSGPAMDEAGRPRLLGRLSQGQPERTVCSKLIGRAAFNVSGRSFKLV